MKCNRNWIAMLSLAALAACGGGDASDGADMAADTSTLTPSPAPVSTVVFPEGITQAMADAGQQTFNTGVCFACHGTNAVGGPLAPPLNDATWLNSDGSWDGIVGTIRNGVPEPKEFTMGPMLPMGGGQYSEQQINELAAYIFSISRGS